MGYCTTFSGQIEIVPALSMKDDAIISKVLEDGRDDTGEDSPNSWCDLEISVEGDYIKWDSSEKTRNMPEWFAYLIKHYFAPSGYVLNGSMDAAGEDNDDMWLLHVEDNVVSTEDMVVTPSGEKFIVT